MRRSSDVGGVGRRLELLKGIVPVRGIVESYLLEMMGIKTEEVNDRA